MMYLILWEADMSYFPTDQEERAKLVVSMAERVKKDLESGDTKMWGISVGGGHGFSITENDPKEVYGILSTYTPYIQFEVQPMLSVDEMIDVLKSMKK